MSIGDSITVPALEEDPYPVYAELREHEPVSWVEALGLWLVTRWDDVRAVDLDPRQFTAETDPSTLNRTFGRNLLGSEGSYHRRVRSIIEPAFRSATLRPFADAVIRPLADALIDEVVDDGRAELMAAFAEPLSVRAVREVVGFHGVDDDMLRRWFAALGLGAANFDRDPDKQRVADAASAEVDEVVGALLEDMAPGTEATVLSRMVASEVDGERLTREEVLANVKVMIVGGMQEPADYIGLAAHALLSHPDQFQEVVDERSHLVPALDEAARWHSPVGTSTRQTTGRVELNGVALEPGSLVAAVLASANRDPRHWADPDAFDIHREGLHMAFGAGGHHCIGAHLAKFIARTAFEQLLDRLPGLRLDTSRPAEFTGWEFRRASHLHVVWDV